MPRKPKPPRGDSGNIPAPTGLTATVTDGHVDLSWNAVANAQGYWIYRNNYVIAVVVQQTTFTDLTATSGYTYIYEIAAVVDTVLGPKCAGVTVNSLLLTYTSTE